MTWHAVDVSTMSLCCANADKAEWKHIVHWKRSSIVTFALLALLDYIRVTGTVGSGGSSTSDFTAFPRDFTSFNLPSWTTNCPYWNSHPSPVSLKEN